MTTDEHRVEVRASAPDVEKALGEATELWGGEWEAGDDGGRFTIPVSVGLRHGHIQGTATVEPLSSGSSVIVRVESGEHRIHVPALVVLIFGALGGLLLVAWPFFPVLIPLTPAGLILLLAAWFLVASRVKTHHLREYLEFLRTVVEPGDPDES